MIPLECKVLCGKEVSAHLKEELRNRVAALQARKVTPHLAAILVGDKPDSRRYVGHKVKMAKELDIKFTLLELPETITQEQLQVEIRRLNRDRRVHGVLVQLKLPDHIKTRVVVEALSPRKDVDCFHPQNVGRLSIDGTCPMPPCTPAGVLELLKYYQYSLKGQRVAMVGQSNIVGKPLSGMLERAGATVFCCQEYTRSLEEITASADILIVAVGKAGLITPEHVKEGAVVIDVGINEKPGGGLVGDVDAEAVKQKVAALTPVPGGVGPLTVTMLMHNTLTAAELQSEGVI